MNTIKNFIDSLFLGISQTEATAQLKNDLLASAEDRYEDLISQGKNEQEVIGTVISEFGTIDELLEEMDLNNNFFGETGDELAPLTIEEALNYLQVHRKAAFQISLGVLVILLSFSLFQGAVVLGSGLFNESLSAAFIFLGAAIGVPLFIIAGIKISNTDKQLQERLIPAAVKQEAKQQRAAFQPTFVFCITLGVILCIVAVIPVIIFSEGHQRGIFNESFGVSLLFLLAGLGVFFLIFGGVIMSSFTKLVEADYFIYKGERSHGYTEKEQRYEEPAWFRKLNKVYWSIVLLLYFCQSFIFNQWAFSWIIFPIAGILRGILKTIFREEK